MSRLTKTLALWFALGAVYLVIEGVWRGGASLFTQENGFTHIVMLPIGGLCGVLVGAINQIPRFYRLPVAVQSLIGAVIALAVEFVSGCAVNLWLGWGVWDYSGRWGNVMGQVCVQYGLLWLLLMPFAIWLEDYLRWMFWREGKPYGLGTIYFEFITGK